jgi:hypothetical protein
MGIERIYRVCAALAESSTRRKMEKERKRWVRVRPSYYEFLVYYPTQCFEKAVNLDALPHGLIYKTWR